MVNVLDYYENAEGKFPIALYLMEFSLGKDPAEYEIEWLYNRGYSTVPHAIRRCKRVSAMEKIILEEIYMSMGFKLESTITRKAIASLLDIGIDTVRANLKKLEDKNFLEVHKYKEKYCYYIKCLSLNPYIVMSEFTHFMQKKYSSRMPKEICDGGVQLQIEKVVKSNNYIEWIASLKEDPSYSNILKVKENYFRHVEEVVRRENKISITIPDI